MANDNDKKAKVNRKIQNIATDIQNNMDGLYTTTYFTTPQGNNDVKGIARDINDSIDQIVNRNMNTIGIPSVSVLYSRIFNKSSDINSLTNGLSKMFEDPMAMDDLYATFMTNRFLRELDEEIDTVCKYMPDLEEALDVKKDAVLSADHFSKDFLNIKFPTDIDNEEFSQRIKELKKKYKLQTLTEEIYDDVAKYGEKFIYCVPYSAAITRLLANKSNTTAPAYSSVRSESTNIDESAIQETFKENTEQYLFNISGKSSKFNIVSFSSKKSIYYESATTTESIVDNVGKKKSATIPIVGSTGTFSIGVEINKTGVIESAVLEAIARNKAKNKIGKSLRESYFEIHEDQSTPQAKGNLNLGNTFTTNFGNTTDGFIDGSNAEEALAKNKVTVPGAVVKSTKREFVIPNYIEKTCLGYYYIELRTKDIGDEITGFRNLLGDPLTGTSGEGKMNFNTVDVLRQEDTMRYVAGQLSQFIDKKFVNNNQDISKEIYEILKYNDLFNSPNIEMIKITFVPPEDMFHFYFKLDEDSHRGISDLARGLIPAKLYASLYITNAIGIMTRGQDKRVYYVKQTVENNIAQTLMNVINQVKMGNFGIRQFNSINTILNITGRFNEFFIPTSSSGDSPINIDVIQGQQFDIHTDLMDILKEMAIDSIDVPYEIVQTRKSVDYAAQITMSSSKFLRTVYKRQEIFQEKISPFISMIYNYEYDENADLEVTLPPPVFLDMANTNQLITNTKEFVDSIIDVEMPNEQDENLKSKYRHNLFMHYIGTHIDISAHKNILEKTQMEIKEEQKESEIATPETPEETGSGGDWY